MKTQTKYKDQKSRILRNRQEKGIKFEQDSNFLKRKRKRNDSNKIINESSIEKETMEDSQRYQPHTEEPMEQKEIFATFPKKDMQDILNVFPGYGKLKIIKKYKNNIIIEFDDIKSAKSIIKNKDKIYQEKGWFIEYFKKKSKITLTGQKGVFKIEESGDEEIKKKENELEEEKKQVIEQENIQEEENAEEKENFIAISEEKEYTNKKWKKKELKGNEGKNDEKTEKEKVQNLGDKDIIEKVLNHDKILQEIKEENEKYKEENEKEKKQLLKLVGVLAEINIQNEKYLKKM